jgi:hypothetical protein
MSLGRKAYEKQLDEDFQEVKEKAGKAPKAPTCERQPQGLIGAMSEAAPKPAAKPAAKAQAKPAWQK